MEKNNTLGESAYYILVLLSITVIAAFSYMTYVFYNVTKGTAAFKFTILIPLPILVSLLLLMLLLAAGKQAVVRELYEFLNKS